MPRMNQSYLPRYANTVASINLNTLVSNDIKGIILDLDNTIISEDDKFISPNVNTWIQKAKDLGIKFYILSNCKSHYRVEYWSSYLTIPATSSARKPIPTGFRKAISYMHLEKSQVAVIGDSLHTDILGAWLVGCPSIQVASLPHPPRWWEKFIGKYVQCPFPKDLELWNFQPIEYDRR
ncbi:MAG: YqeG family HAD IIIA-type phosphatase [Acaryochloridaceae cyanobacterium SU_2_1]|nr:YqeG family HAD IIIA-type phosphatase [Acaryochloridaceae cyanobacterium SU_2_1]